MAFEWLSREAAIQLPHSHRAIGPARGDPVALGRERDAKDRSIMAFERLTRGAAIQLPYTHCAIGPARDHPIALWREGYAKDRSVMTSPDFQLLLLTHRLDQRTRRLPYPAATERISRTRGQARERKLHRCNGQALAELLSRLLGTVEGIAELCFGFGAGRLPPVPSRQGRQRKKDNRDGDQSASDPEVLPDLSLTLVPACLHQAPNGFPSSAVA